MLRSRLPAINAEGSFECALRAYLALARIARQRAQYDLAAILLHEAEGLADRRGWCRLVAACVVERVSLLLETGLAVDAIVAWTSTNVQNLASHPVAAMVASVRLSKLLKSTCWPVLRKGSNTSSVPLSLAVFS